MHHTWIKSTFAIPSYIELSWSYRNNLKWFLTKTDWLVSIRLSWLGNKRSQKLYKSVFWKFSFMNIIELLQARYEFIIFWPDPENMFYILLQWFYFSFKTFSFFKKNNKKTKIYTNSPQNSSRQLAIVKGFAEANSVFIVINLAKILLRWLFPNKIYIQFTILKTYFLTKLKFKNKRYHLQVLEKCIYVLQVINYIFLAVYSSSFSSFMWQWNKFCFHILYHRMTKFCNIKFLNNFYFVSFFYHLFKCSILQ